MKTNGRRNRVVFKMLNSEDQMQIKGGKSMGIRENNQ
jgi:hypothetical protein